MVEQVTLLSVVTVGIAIGGVVVMAFLKRQLVA